MDKEFLTLDEIKQVQLDMLDAFDGFCKENNLTYWLTEGSLLGAVRHHGYIPWDDDLDLGMPISSYLKLLELASSDEGHEFFTNHNIRVAENGVPSDIPYHQTFAKLYDTRTQASKGILAYEREGFIESVFIDIFPVVGLTDTPEEAEKLKKLSKYYANLRYSSEAFWPAARIEGKKRFIKRLVGYLPARAKGYKYWLNAFCELRNTFPDPFDYEAFAMPDTESLRFALGKNIKTALYQFEGRMIPSFQDYDTFLSIHYGNYMQFPPEEERVPLHAQDFWWVCQ